MRLIFNTGTLWATHYAAASHTLDCILEDDCKEGDKQEKYKPDVNNPHVGGWRQSLYLAGKDGGHHQHYGQVDSNDVAEEDVVEKVGGIDNEEEQS